MSAPAAPELQRLALLIEAEAVQLRELITLLEEEQSRLLANDIDRLLVLTTEKTSRYQQLQRLYANKINLLERLGKTNPDTAIREFYAEMPRVLARWDEVLAYARTAKEQNMLNGKLITERMQHNQTALSVLLSAANHPQLYDATGNTLPAGHGRSLGSA